MCDLQLKLLNVFLHQAWSWAAGTNCLVKQKQVFPVKRAAARSDLMMVCMPRTWGELSITLRVLGKGWPWWADARADLQETNRKKQKTLRFLYAQGNVKTPKLDSDFRTTNRRTDGCSDGQMNGWRVQIFFHPQTYPNLENTSTAA